MMWPGWAMVTAADWLEGLAAESGWGPAGPGCVAARWLGVALRGVLAEG